MKKIQGGYIGIIALLIAVLIIAFWAVKVYAPMISKSSSTSVDQGQSAIQKAEEAKKALENQSNQINKYINSRPKTIYPGDPVLLTFEGTPTKVLWDTKVIPVFIYQGKSRALVPITFEEKVLQHTVTATFSGHTEFGEVTITPRPKIEKPLGIPEKLGGNTPQAASNLLKNLADENYILNSVKTATTTLWSTGFRYPVSNVFITDDYGYSRNTVNQTITHKGTDFRATIGTDVFAMNDGIVRLARTFTVYGNAVVIDHGLGVQSLYMHLSKLNVKEGERVKKGQLLGQSGDTGYVDAPHLHISVKINSVSIDPITFLKFF